MAQQPLALVGVKDVQRRTVLGDGKTRGGLHDHSVCDP
jgi:hypothetical protein